MNWKWDFIRAFVLVSHFLTFGLLLTNFPEPLWIPIASFICLAVVFGFVSLLKSSQLWARFALVVWAVSFASSLAVHWALGSLLQGLPLLLLTYVMIIFSVEALNLSLQHSPAHSGVMRALLPSQATPAIQKSMEQMSRKLTHLGLMLGSCYLLALGVVTAESVFASLMPFLSDMSLYVVAVSVSLALLLVLREEEAQ